ncbi:hypothetical protein SPSYN_02801 [Sporotomaculum syntrophicum]|uniref:Lipoprotein n=1 Tax=Sporotomaculum syntrophicum TaxID=182264 RepID=A0A9D2WMA9_9FIRM|nr:hypothetical protein [Sporotomaculum syntrophicum]KAF1083889.1 hypothetical protein SPSYN_02801 [Sporotomaculum syntrophicum]
MKKLTVLVILLSTLLVFGCNQAQQKPVTPEQTLIPKESTIGFSQVDVDELPAAIQKVATAMENRAMVTWASENNNSYILINTGRDKENFKVSKVIQMVPVQDFLWLDVQLDYTDGNLAKELKENSKLVAVKLEQTDKTINGVGFEIKEESDEESQDESNAAKAAPQTTRQPVSQVPITDKERGRRDEPIQQIERPAPTRETSPAQEPAKDQTMPEDKEDSTPVVPNGD